MIDGFAYDLAEKYRETIHRFLAIQTFGSEKAKPVIRELKEKVFANGEPHMDSLSKGLQILKECSLWDATHQIQCPTLIILGEKDTLIPVSSGEKTQSVIKNSELKIIKGRESNKVKAYSDFICPTCKAVLCIETDLDPFNVSLATYVNGECRQSGNTSDLIFSVARSESSLRNSRVFRTESLRSCDNFSMRVCW